MKMTKYHVENFARIKLFDIELDPNNNFVIVSGANSAGKSSATMALWNLFEGRNAGKKVTMPVRQGADKAVISVKLDNGVLVEKVIRASDGKEVLKITNADGMSSSKQGYLDNILGTSLNIEAFRGLDKHKQMEVLLDVVGLRAKFTELKSQYDVTYQQRTEIGRARDLYKTQTTAVPEQVSPIDVTALMQEASQLENQQSENRRHTEFINTAKSAIEQAACRITELLTSIETTKAEIIKRESMIVPVDVEKATKIAATINTANETNRKAGAWEMYQDRLEKFNAQDTVYNTKTAQLEQLKTAEKELLTTAKFPLDGITFTDEVLFNGVPLKQLEGGSEELFVNFAIAVASIPKDGLRVIRVPDGEKLDPQSRARLVDMANKADVQVLFEMVDTTGTQGVYIEDGEIATNNYGKK
jgi:recombinational DNA repair ATPase RecF